MLALLPMLPESTVNESSHNRVIIGESGQAGVPISAEWKDDKFPFSGQIRWRDCATHFVLEQWFLGKWYEVGCVPCPPDNP